VVIASEMQDQALDHESLKPFWKAACDLGLYVFIHPLAKVINWNRMDADDLGRMFGWEFSLMIATIRVINSGLLDELPDLKIHFSHFSGGIGRYRGRYNGFQQRTKWGTSQIKGHNRQPKLAGPAPIRAGRSAPTGSSSACRSWRCRNACSRPTTRRRSAIPAR